MKGRASKHALFLFLFYRKDNYMSIIMTGITASQIQHYSPIDPCNLVYPPKTHIAASRNPFYSNND